MLKDIPRESPAFKSIYHGKTLALKFGGDEIGSPDFPTCAEDMAALAEGGTNIIGITGAGKQISAHYGKPRRKIDGVAVTDEDLMANGVHPAQEEIKQRLLSLMPGAVILDAEHVECSLHPDPRYGLVGIPTNLVLPEHPLVFLRSIGTVQTGEGPATVNVNADDIARQLVEQYKYRIEELMLLTPTGGVLDREGRIVSLLTDKRLDKILTGSDEQVTVDGGMLKKLAEVRAALDQVGKVVITSARGLRSEIENWMGSGTLCIASNQLAISPLRYMESPVFDAVNEACVAEGRWRKRTPAELDALKMYHSVVRVKNSPLGGMSLVPRGDWTELSALWAGAIGNGMGQLLLDTALAESRGRKMYALCSTPDAIGAFSAHRGFRCIGRLSDLIADGNPDLPSPLRTETRDASYDTSKRFVFIAQESAA